MLDLTPTAELLADTVLFCHTQFEDQLPNSAGEQKDAVHCDLLGDYCMSCRGVEWGRADRSTASFSVGFCQQLTTFLVLTVQTGVRNVRLLPFLCLPPSLGR